MVGDRRATPLSRAELEAAGEPQRKKPTTAPAECAKCGCKTQARWKLNFYVCRCGWLIKVEPRIDPAGNRYVHVDPVIRSHYEMTEDEQQKPLKTLSRDVDSGDLLTPSQIGVRQVLREWMSRRLCWMEIDKTSRRYGIQFMAAEDVAHE